MDKVFYNQASASKLGWQPDWFGEKEFDDDLVDAIIKWQKDNDERKVFVWSANGDAWAATAATAFFNAIIPIENTGGKDKLFSTVTSTDLAIDDREAQWYLKPFESVFKPQEFIKYME